MGGVILGKLKIREHMTTKEKRMALEAALLLGFQAEASVFPVAGSKGEIPVPENEQELKALYHISGSDLPEGYEPAKGHPEPMFDLDFRKEKGLETVFCKGPFLKDEDFDLLPDKLDVKIILPENADVSTMIAACNIAFRLGMETTGYEGGILADADYCGNAIVLEDGDRAEMTLEETDEAVRVHLKGRGADLETLSALICEKFPGMGGFRQFRDVMMEMCDDAVLRNANGQIAALKAWKQKEEGAYTVYGSPELSDKQKALFENVIFENYKAGRKAYEKVYELPWEVETFEALLEEHVFPTLKVGDTLRVEGAVSENQEIRRCMAEKIEERAKGLGVSTVETELICAYKQGFSWMNEIVIPAVKEQKPDKVEIYFKPFLPEGETRWLDENGATPSYHNLQADNPDKWYDLPIRYLQELYPIEDVLIRELGIPRDAVVFLPYEGEERLTYLCRVYQGQAICYENTYEARCSERPYLDEYPQMGKVHPATGYIRAWINGEEVLHKNIRTDLEAVWDTYQAEVLPDCKRYIEEKNGGVITPEQQPFFQELLLDVTVSEPDFRVGCREDLISSLDALHEDMYFTGSDYFKNYGVQNIGVMLDAPGLILPSIHQREGRPALKVTVFEKLKEKPCITKDGTVIESMRKREDVSFKVTRLWEKNGKLGVEISAKGVTEEYLKAYAGLLEQGVLEILEGWQQIGEIHFVSESGSVAGAMIRATETKTCLKAITDIDLSEKELIGYEEYLTIIEELKHVPGIEVFRTARSYTGRELYAIWLKPKREGYLSMTKRLTNCPSEIINARHHANEVSSTNASFILLKKLLTEETYKELPEKLNLILVPMENVDGAAIHYGLQKEHPYWKFHVARFNALGKEFFHEHFRQDTIHGEAMGLSRLYERYAPDMIVDNHGVPSHEWEQQFSGYTSPSYKGFWLPRSLLYGYFWYVTDEEYKDNYPVNKKMEDVIADKIAEDPEMTALNKEWSAQFEKYAHAWMPKLFPANYYKNMINYWIPYTADPAHKYPSIRFPWITTVSYTSEVADETAQGDYLNLCARAHVAHDEATLQMLMQATHLKESSISCKEGEVSASYRRLRPMIV